MTKLWKLQIPNELAGMYLRNAFMTLPVSLSPRFSGVECRARLGKPFQRFSSLKPHKDMPLKRLIHNHHALHTPLKRGVNAKEFSQKYSRIDSLNQQCVGERRVPGSATVPVAVSGVSPEHSSPMFVGERAGREKICPEPQRKMGFYDAPGSCLVMMPL
jgi:hypothetical protein